MKTDTFQLRTQAILAQRIHSLCLDGYTILVQSRSPSYSFYKLKHMRNGSVIIITASPVDDYMTQRVNNTLVYSGKIQP